MVREAPGATRHAALLLLLGAAGCVSSIRGDVDRVQELARVRLGPADFDGEVDPVTNGTIRDVLATPLDADAAVRVALLNNRALRGELRELGVARGRVLQAGLLPNPRLEVEFLPERNTSLELRVEYDVRGLLLAPLQSRAAEYDLQAARYHAAAAVVALGFEVRAAFYGLQAAEQQLAVGQRTLDAYAAGRDFARALVEAGNLPPVDASTQNAAYQEARVTVAELELEALDRREEVQRLLGLHGDETRWTVRGTLGSAPDALTIPEGSEGRALTASLEAAAMRSQMEGAARRAGVARVAGLIPELTGDVHVLAGDPAQGGGVDALGRNWNVGAGFTLALPLFDRQQGRVREFVAEFDGLMERYVGLGIDLRSLVRAARNRLASTHARARQYDAVILPARAQVLEETVLQYNAMQTGVLQLLEARRAQLDAELSAIETRRAYWTAAAAFQALLAGARVDARGDGRGDGRRGTAGRNVMGSSASQGER